MNKYSLVSFDMDGTIIFYPYGDFGSSWDAIGFNTSKIVEWKALITKYQPSCYDPKIYEEWITENGKLLQGLSVKPIFDKIIPIHYVEGFKDAVYELKRHGHIVGILSSGVDLIGNKIKEELKLDFCICNGICLENEIFTGEVKCQVSLSEKLEAFKRLLEEYKIAPEKAVHVGDHVNDVSIFEVAGLGIAFNPKREIVRRKADVVIDSGDLRDILKYII